MDAAKALIKDIIAGAIAEELLDTEIDNILGLHGIDILEAFVQIFKVFPLEVYGIEVLLENAILTCILKFNEAILPKHIAAEMDRICSLRLVVLEIDEIS